MKIRQVRNAPCDLRRHDIPDRPFLAEKGACPAFGGTVDAHPRNPCMALKTPMETIRDVDGAIVTHLHFDRGHAAAIRPMPKDTPIFARDYSGAVGERLSNFTRSGSCRRRCPHRCQAWNRRRTGNAYKNTRHY